MNRKGDEKVMSFYWFVMFIIIAVVLASGIILYFSKPIDVREIEAGLLVDKVIGCVVSQGVLDVGKLGGLTDENFEEVCGFSVIDNARETGSEEYFVKLEAGGKVLNAGDGNFEAFCFDAKSDKNIPVCLERELIVFNGGYEKIKILVSVRKTEQNAV